MNFSHCNILYSRIRERMRKNNEFCGHYYDAQDIPPFVLYYKAKPLPDRFISYTDLNVHKFDTIRIEFMGLQGGTPEEVCTNTATFSIKIPYFAEGTTTEFDVNFRTSYTLSCIATIFGCDLFSHGYPADPNAGFYITRMTERGEQFIPLDLWELEYRFFEHTDFIFYYSWQRADVPASLFFRSWPNSDYEYDSDDNISEYSLSSTIDTQTSSEDDFYSDQDLTNFDDAEEIILNTLSINSNESGFTEQSGRYPDAPFNEQSGQFPYQTQRGLYNFFRTIQLKLHSKDYAERLVEDTLLLVNGLYNCHNNERIDYQRVVTVIITFLKLRSNRSILSMFADSKILDYLKTLITPEEESGFIDALNSAGDIIGAIKQGKKLKISKVLYRLGMFAMSMSLFDSVGLSLDLFGYTQFDKELLKRKNQLTGDIVLDLADGVIFLLKKGYQIILTGRIDCIYHTEDEYSKLYDDILDLKVKKVALSNPEALGFNEYWYGDKLDKTMEKLRNIIKFGASLDKTEMRYWRSQLCELELIKNNILIAKNCSESRECPFSLLFFASPGVGKSTLTKMTFQHLAKTHKLPTEDKFMYIRNPMAKFTDGFKSEMHTYLLDDISFKHPAANPNGDVSLDEVYMLHGTFPYIPDQAALEDKGRIPVRIKFLLGTTNVRDLNAYHYFSVPSAMQRRFPYIVEVFVKKQFQKDDGSGMLDASKTKCDPDDYPDYWMLKVSKIIVPKQLGELAKLQHVNTFNDINDFTEWLSQASLEHFANEKIMTTSFTNMRTVPICDKCFRNVRKCSCLREQSGVRHDGAMSWFTYWLALFIYYLYRNMAYILFDRTYWKIRNSIEDYLIRWDYQCVNEYVRRRRLMDVAHSARRKIGYPEVFGLLATILISFYAIFKFRRTVAGVNFAEQTAFVTGDEDLTKPRPPKSNGHEKEQTWVANDKKLSTLDLTPQILSSVQHSREEFSSMISRNVVRLVIYDINDPKNKFVNNGVVVRNNTILCNAHYFRNIQNNSVRMIIISGELGDGVNEKIDILIDKSLVYMDNYRDIAIFVAHSLVPKRDISKYFAKRGVYTEATGTLIGRDPRYGTVQYNTIHGITLRDEYEDSWGSHPYKGPATFGLSTILTMDGDCGSLLVAHTPKGHFVTGIHRAGNVERMVIGVLIYYEDLMGFLEKIPTLAVSAGTPKLAHTVQSLHPKSVFNYIQDGTAAVYGSISDFKTNQRSRVCATIMRDYLVKYENYPVDYRSPQLKGYKPFYIAALGLTKPITDFNETLLRNCASSFYKDILKNLPEGEISTLVHKYDLFTCVNGAAGIAFVDGINRSTSMGYPYCTSKRKFLKQLPPTRDLCEPVEFTEEIQEEFFRYLETYKTSQRAYPVYKATLKDEAVSHNKYLIGKTRVFGSAPIVYILIQRMFFLSSVRLIQTHKMAFECAVGVIATTREWELFYNKLNIFPYKFAGDFKLFDKQMCPLVMLLAYWILIRINMQSGNYTAEDEKTMWGIATDTAYPFMLYNGDFVQFSGSNPSGQSLTVIINSLVNSLYLRYTYVILYRENVDNFASDEEILASFQQHVMLFVYGDDNQISTDLPWFNFANVQRVFQSVGITYTPPTKDDSTYDFMEMEDIDFLKRSYKYDDNLQAIVAPLSIDSINKMLTTWVASDSVSPEVQALATISSAIREYFFHGREIFEEKREMFIRLLVHLNLQHGVNTTILPTYEMLIERYNDASAKIFARLPQHSFTEQSGLLLTRPSIDPDWWVKYIGYDNYLQEKYAMLMLFVIFSLWLIAMITAFGLILTDDLRFLKLLPFVVYNIFFLYINVIQVEYLVLGYALSRAYKLFA